MNQPISADLVRQITEAVINEIACVNAGIQPADIDSLNLVEARANAELAKARLEQTKLELEKLRLEKQKLQQDIAQQQLHERLETAKLQAEVKLKQQQAYEKERENSIWLQSEDDDEDSRRGWEDYEKRARAIRRAHGFDF